MAYNPQYDDTLNAYYDKKNKQKAINDWIASQGGAADVGMAEMALGYNKPTQPTITQPTQSTLLTNTVSTTPTMSPQVTQPTQPQFDIQAYIKQLADAKRNQLKAGLDSARSNALSNLSAEESTIRPKYYSARNQAAGAKAAGARSFSEYLAKRGLSNSGSAAQAEINQNMQYQGQIGALDQAEAQNYADIGRRRSDVENTYQFDLANANADIESNALQQSIAEYQRQQDIARQQALTDRQFAYQQEQDKLDNQYRQEQLLAERAAQEASARAAAERAAQEAAQQAFENELKVQEALRKQRETEYSTQKPYYNPNTSSKTKQTSDKYSLQW